MNEQVEQTTKEIPTKQENYDIPAAANEKKTKTELGNENILLREQIKLLTETVQKLQQQLEYESKSREEAIKKIQEEKVTNVIQDAIKKGKIPPEKAESWKQKLLKNYDEFIEVINELPENPKLNKEEPTQAQSNAKTVPKDASHTDLLELAKQQMQAKINQTY